MRGRARRGGVRGSGVAAAQHGELVERLGPAEVLVGEAAPKPEPEAEPKKSGGGKKTKEQKRREAEQRNRLYPAMQKNVAPKNIEAPKLLGRLVEKLENEVARKEDEKAALEAKLADPDFYQQGEAFQQTMRAFADIEAELKDLMKRWEQAAAKLEAAEA